METTDRARAAQLAEQIRRWRDDDSAGYDRVIELVCEAEAVLAALYTSPKAEPLTARAINSSQEQIEGQVSTAEGDAVSSREASMRWQARAEEAEAQVTALREENAQLTRAVQGNALAAANISGVAARQIAVLREALRRIEARAAVRSPLVSAEHALKWILAAARSALTEQGETDGD